LRGLAAQAGFDACDRDDELDRAERGGDGGVDVVVAGHEVGVLLQEDRLNRRATVGSC